MGFSEMGLNDTDSTTNYKERRGEWADSGETNLYKADGAREPGQGSWKERRLRAAGQSRGRSYQGSGDQPDHRQLQMESQAWENRPSGRFLGP